MIKLGPRAWNNVLIFAMLFMVYLFSVSNNLLNKSEDVPEVMPLLPPYSVIMSIQFADVKIERIGQDWRIDNNAYQASELSLLLQRWESLEVMPIERAADNNPYIVTLMIAGEEKPRVVGLFEMNDDAVLRFQGQFFKVAALDFGSLVP